MSANSRAPLACILGCSGPTLTEAEKAFFAKTNPYGFILFARNVDTPDQVRALVDDLRASVERDDAPVLIDQEGGRVQRLRPPNWVARPNGAKFAALAAKDMAHAESTLRLNFQLIGRDLADLGIDVDCAPVADVPIPGADNVIGDRAYGTSPVAVAVLARAVMEGLLDQGIMPIVKHIPGHGRAMVDSHASLPRVDADLEDLKASDFKAFRLINDAPWAMTAHVVYDAIDPHFPATLSKRVIHQVIRDEIGFSGVLISDDLSMRALQGTFDRRAADSLAAGCDLVLHCNGDMAEMEAVVAGTLPISDHTAERLAAANARRRFLPPPPADAAAEIDRLLDPSCPT